MLFGRHVKYNSGGMVGYSKWTQIKRKKGIENPKKDVDFITRSKQIILVVNEGESVTDRERNIKPHLLIDMVRGRTYAKRRRRPCYTLRGSGPQINLLFTSVQVK